MDLDDCDESPLELINALYTTYNIYRVVVLTETLEEAASLSTLLNAHLYSNHLVTDDNKYEPPDPSRTRMYVLPTELLFYVDTSQVNVCICNTRKTMFRALKHDAIKHMSDLQLIMHL